MRPSAKVWTALLILGGVAYPVCVYLSHGKIPFWCFPAVAACLFALRSQALGRKIGARGAAAAACGALVCVLVAAALRPHMAAHLYPVAVSLLFAFLFGFSLLFPPTVIERIARLKTPDLPEAGVKYTRCVTWIWFVFLVCNAAIAYGLAFLGELKLWMLWTTVYSYICMGLLFAGEFAFRKLKRLDAS